MMDLKLSIALWILILFLNLHKAWSRPHEPPLSYKDTVATLNFMVVGDWGGQNDSPYYTDPEQDVAEQMGQVAAAMGAQFTLSMGDNFYDNGVTDMDDPRFKETFEVSTTIHGLTDHNRTAWLCVCYNILSYLGLCMFIRCMYKSVKCVHACMSQFLYINYSIMKEEPHRHYTVRL